MASYNVKKLCKKIEEQCNIVCQPDTFTANKNRLMVETGSWVWSMIVDMEKTKKLQKSGWQFVCGSNEYMKDLLKDNVKLECNTNIDVYCYGAEVTIRSKEDKVMTDAEYEFYSFWKEILLEERQNGNLKRVEEIESMLRNKGLPIPSNV